jgi:hypothetical protein
MKISTLRIEPHRVKPDTSREYFASKEGSIAWRIWVDDEKVVEMAHPFVAEDSLIDLCFDPNFPIWGDYRCFLSVRKVGEYVIWSEPLEEDEWVSSDWAHLRGLQVYVFDLGDYIKSVSSCLCKINPVCRNIILSNTKTK